MDFHTTHTPSFMITEPSDDKKDIIMLVIGITALICGFLLGLYASKKQYTKLAVFFGLLFIVGVILLGIAISNIVKDQEED